MTDFGGGVAMFLSFGDAACRGIKLNVMAPPQAALLETNATLGVTRSTTMSQHFGSDLPEDVDEYADADLLGDPSPEEEDEVASTNSNSGYELQEAPDSLFPRGDESTEDEDTVFGMRFPCKFRTQTKLDGPKYQAVFLEIGHPLVGAKLGKKRGYQRVRSGGFEQGAYR